MITKILSSLEKVFLDQEPKAAPGLVPEGFMGETISFQLAYCMPNDARRFDTYCQLRIESDIAEFVRLRRVVHVPVHLSVYCDADDDYVRKAPGLYPDMLVDVDQCKLRCLPGDWNTIWVDVEGAPAGEHQIKFIISNSGADVAEQTATVRVLAAELPAQELTYTRWLHCDSIAQYYHVVMFSEKFWCYL